MNYNRTIIAGNLTKDPELRQTANGTSVCTFSVAMNEHQKDGTNRVSFVECQAFSKSAENIAKYFKKGQQIIVEGRLQQQTWKDKKTNENRSKLIVLLEHWEFVGSKNDNAGDVQKQEATTKVNAASQSDYIEDDDVPF